MESVKVYCILDLRHMKHAGCGLHHTLYFFSLSRNMLLFLGHINDGLVAVGALCFKCTFVTLWFLRAKVVSGRMSTECGNSFKKRS